MIATQSLRCSLRIAIIFANHYRSVELITVESFVSTSQAEKVFVYQAKLIGKEVWKFQSARRISKRAILSCNSIVDMQGMITLEGSFSYSPIC